MSLIQIRKIQIVHIMNKAEIDKVKKSQMVKINDKR